MRCNRDVGTLTAIPAVSSIGQTATARDGPHVDGDTYGVVRPSGAGL